MKQLKKMFMAAGLVAALGLAGCWGDDGDDPLAPVPSAEVPSSAGVSTASFVSFLLSLSASDESSEPLTIGESFAVPADEGAEPTPLP
jgi:hypothetical protein